MLGQLVTTSGEKKAEFANRGKSYDEITVDFSNREEKEANGWTVHRKNKNSLRMRKPKSFDEILENRFWSILYRFGYSELNKGRNFKIRLSDLEDATLKQIDVFAKDEETVVVAECKASEKTRKRSMQKDIGEFSGLQKPIADAIRKSYDSSYKPKIIWCMVTDKIRWNSEDLKRAEENNIHVIQSLELLYFEEFSKKLGHAARYQFHAEYLANQKVPALSGRTVPAVRTKLGKTDVYLFSALPRDILRIAFVNHRDLRDPSGAPSYQRIVAPSRLKQIGKFLQGGGFFPNTILLNFHRSPNFNRKAKDDVSGIQFGDLLLPDRYKSCWVIDGQHRLYGTTFTEVETKSPLFFIAFDKVEAADEANIFVQINSKQTKVSPGLLAALDGEVKWDSADLKERLSAISSRAIDLLNSKGSSALEGKVVPPGISGNKDQPLNLPSLQAGINQSKLLGAINPRTGELIPGPCWENDSTGSLQRLVDFLSIHFDKVETANPTRWAAGKQGYLCSNFGVVSHIRLLGELVSYAAVKSGFTPAASEVDELYCAIQPLLQPVLDFISDATDAEFSGLFKVMFGSGGNTQYFFRLVELVRKVDESFIPEGFEEYTHSMSSDTVLQADKDVRWIQSAVPEYVISVLKRLYGDDFFEKGVPREIQKTCQSKRIDEEVESRLPVETYLDWIQLRKIIEQKEVRNEVKNALSIPLDSEPPGKHFYTAWFDEFNKIRRIPAHPMGRGYTDSNIELLVKLTDHLKLNLPHQSTSET